MKSNELAIFKYGDKSTNTINKNDKIVLTEESIPQWYVVIHPLLKKLSVMFISEKVTDDNNPSFYGVHDLRNFELIECKDKFWKKWFVLAKYGEISIDRSDCSKQLALAKDTEQFIDEDTGEVVDVTSLYMIAVNGRPIRPILYSPSTKFEFLCKNKSLRMTVKNQTFPNHDKN